MERILGTAVVTFRDFSLHMDFDRNFLYAMNKDMQFSISSNPDEVDVAPEDTWTSIVANLQRTDGWDDFLMLAEDCRFELRGV